MRVCVSDAGPLTPERDAGSRATSDAIQTLRSLGHEVVFRSIPEIDDLRGFDLFVASRPGPAVHAMTVPGFGQIPSIFFGHDLHFQRMAGVLEADRVEMFRRLEAMCWRTYDLSIYPSADEAAYVNQQQGSVRCIALPIYVMGPSAGTPRDEFSYPACVFVGSSGHAPNHAAVDMLIEEVWPRVLEREEARLHLVGEWDVVAVDAKVGNVTVHTGISESDLNALVAHSWLSVAPLSFGAGVKRKVVHSLHCGTPVVGSSIAFQGLLDGAGHPVGGVVADSPNNVAASIVNLLRDGDQRALMGARGRQWVAEHYSQEASRQGWTQAIEYALERFESKPDS